MAFFSCDRGSIAFDGDYLFADLLSDDNDDEGNVGGDVEKKCEGDVTLGQFMDRLGITITDNNDEDEEVMIVSNKDVSNGDENNGGESYKDIVVYEDEEEE
eukprot:scaffold129433_cov18-Cyclotella_meneghiniana.AAC.1